MITEALLRTADRLSREGKPFVLAVVVRREAPISVQTGDKAVIEADGTLHGWIGGGCTRPVILREARMALRDGRPRLVRVTPEADSRPQQGVSEHAMACHSGGTLDVYIEPVLPRTQLIILGRSPVAQSLVRLGKALGCQVAVAAPKTVPEDFPEADWVHERIDLSQLDPAPRQGVVICTQGEQDETALREALKTQAAYIALVASRKKALGLFRELSDQGIDPQQFSRVKAPAGLDIGAGTSAEIAVSILAEFIQRLHACPDPAAAPLFAAPQQEARDPICGMTVDPATAEHIFEWQGETYYFCCAGCKAKFESDPEGFTQRR